MRRIVTAVLAAGLVLGPVAGSHAAPSSVQSVAQAATPKPGQFCKKADRGVKKAGLVCKADPKNSRYSRWYR